MWPSGTFFSLFQVTFVYKQQEMEWNKQIFQGHVGKCTETSQNEPKTINILMSKQLNSC